MSAGDSGEGLCIRWKTSGYTKGASEEMLGALLQGQRNDWVIASKLGNKMSDRVNESLF